MHALIRLSSGVAVIFILATDIHAQTQTRPDAPPAPARVPTVSKAATAVIEGRVVAADSGVPLYRARLVLTAAGLERPFYVSADREGRYEFTELPAGRYTVTASNSGFVTWQYGQRRAFEGGLPIDVAEAATLDDIDLALPRSGVISGTVVDGRGEPVGLVHVTAFRAQFEEGKRKLVAIGQAAETGELGEYNLCNLEPGTYFVGTLPAPGTSPDRYRFAPAYYPNTLNAAEAQPITIDVGQQQADVTLVLPPGLLASISGRVIDAAGHPLPDAVVSISSVTGDSVSTPVKDDGSFTIQNIVPGKYGLVGMLSGPAPGDELLAAIPVTVTGEDLRDFVLQIAPGSRLTGRIVTEEDLPPAARAAGVRVEAIPVELDELDAPVRGRNPDAQGSVTASWTFEIDGIAGPWLFRPRQLPAGYMLKSVSLGGRDITDTPLEVKGSEDINGLRVVITNRLTKLTGTVSNAKGQPVTDYTVVVFPEDATRWKRRSRFLDTAFADQRGEFTIEELPPGRYLAVALEYVDQMQSQNPVFLEALRPLATKVVLGEGETKILELKLTKPEAGYEPMKARRQ